MASLSYVLKNACIVPNCSQEGRAFQTQLPDVEKMRHSSRAEGTRQVPQLPTPIHREMPGEPGVPSQSREGLPCLQTTVATRLEGTSAWASLSLEAGEDGLAAVLAP